ncbi:CobW family GTP-binding protein [Methylopila henanensis]|uniref:CobW family GTP-binding protein n=1 Tax=Methylopila henanensis TaxID=873516 RepID=A0ABW4KAL1_9HYPH
MSRLPVNILTGFLGSGKTTLLKRLLAEPELANTAVLVNEFGEAGLDHLLLERIADDVVLLKSGCLCCTVRGDLRDALMALLGRRARGEIAGFDRIVIETTGLADPGPVVATLAADPALRHQLRTGAIVTVVDAMLGEATLDAHEESVRQAAVADRLILTKTDLAPEAAAARVRTRLANLNPAAPVIELFPDDAPSPDLLLADVHDDATRAVEVRRWLAAGAGRHGAVRAFALAAEQPLDWARFGLWLSMLLNRHGDRILRLKGLVAVEGVDTPVVIQGVQHLVHAPVHLDAWPDGRPATKLVVIAHGLDPALVERSFRAFCRVAPPAAHVAA